MKTNVNVYTVVNDLQEEIDATKANKQLDFEKRVKLIISLTKTQLQAGGLQLGYLRAASRLPEDGSRKVLQLNETPEATKQ